MTDWVLQSPDEILDWHNDWTDWMEDQDVISASEWAITPWGIIDTGGTPTLADDTIDISADLTSVFVSGLEAGVSYQLKNTVTTAAGRVGVREITIRCDRQ